MLFNTIKPMLAKKIDKPFNSPNYIWEPKLDGIRLILMASFKDQKIVLQTRNGNIITNQLPEFLDLSLPGVDSIILDGELIALTDGRPDFNKVMQRISTGKEKAKQLSETLPVSMSAFDILYLNGEGLTYTPLLRRKEILEDTVPDTDLLSKVMFVENDGIALYNQIVYMKLEGVVAKAKNGTYRRNHRGWYKHKHYHRAEMDVLGYVFGSGKLLVGKENTSIAQALGLPPTHRDALVRLFPEIGVRREKDIMFIEKGLRCNIKYTVGARNQMRECVFDGWVFKPSVFNQS